MIAQCGTLLVVMLSGRLSALHTWGWPLLVSAADLINVRDLTRQMEMMRDVI